MRADPPETLWPLDSRKKLVTLFSLMDDSPDAAEAFRLAMLPSTTRSSAAAAASCRRCSSRSRAPVTQSVSSVVMKMSSRKWSRNSAPVRRSGTFTSTWVVASRVSSFCVAAVRSWSASAASVSCRCSGGSRLFSWRRMVTVGGAERRSPRPSSENCTRGAVTAPGAKASSSVTSRFKRPGVPANARRPSAAPAASSWRRFTSSASVLKT
mmetsp:Transcript_16617/g.51520  ORF Transcript_16617/g.51520 Transcript_16617/m.51520 type:complete len:210 (-) Transcript_16617:53-682(-)